jgi:hypothetical protein
MSAEDRSLIAAAEQKLAELEASMNLAIGAMRASLVLVEEENRELRRESIERRNEYYTEREFGAVLKVSEATMARLRRAGKLEHLMVGNQVRYTSAHLAQFVNERAAGKKVGGTRR